MKILVVAHPDDPLAHFVAKGFQGSFTSLGHQADLLPEYKSGYDVCLLMYAHVRYNLPKDKTYKIAYNWEYTPHPTWRKAIRRYIDQFDCLWEINEDNFQIDMPIKRMFCPVWYHPSFESVPTPGEQRKVSFLGYVKAAQGNRVRIVDKIEKELGIKIWCAREKNEYVHTTKLSDIVHNTKIHLNIHQNPRYIMFECIRVIGTLLSNKCFVISQVSRGSPLISGKHYIETNDLIPSIKYYLEHEEERKQIAQQGYEFIKANCRLEDKVRECLKQI